VILLTPVIQGWRERRRVWPALAAATVPITLIGLGLMLYNALRFDNPFEFGWHYMLAGVQQDTGQHFSLRYLWFNFRVYFLEPARWSARFPFVHGIAVPPLPAGYFVAGTAFGILTNIPLVWLALAAPLAWRRRSGQAGSTLRWFVAAAALLFGINALTDGTFFAADIRYAIDFLPALVLLAVVGILGLERALAPTPTSETETGQASESGLADRRVWRRATRCGWGLLLGFSVIFNVLVSIRNYSDVDCSMGRMLAIKGRVPEAIRAFESALRIDPDYAEAHTELGVALARTGKIEEAIKHYEQALRIEPDFADAHADLGVALAQTGNIEEAIAHFEQALRANPDFAEAHNSLGATLERTGKIEEAIAHFEQALRVNPDFAEAHYGLGAALAQTGKTEEAIAHFEQALRINPDYAEAHTDLGAALARMGKIEEAIKHYEQVLRIKPDSADAHNSLGNLLAQAGRLPEAIKHLEAALRMNPDSARAHYNLGIALGLADRLPEAIEHLRQALRINPDYAEAHYNLGIDLAQTGKIEEAIAHFEQALRIKPDFTQAQTALAQLQARQ
ncbi:MAG: tetratricopeptide repeat protein, partial [Verrucomicrobiia bacterium]